MGQLYTDRHGLDSDRILTSECKQVKLVKKSSNKVLVSGIV